MALLDPTPKAASVVGDHRFHPVRIGRVVTETADAKSFVLDIPESLRADFAYRSGQFCNFRVWVDGEPHIRCYSMSSSPAVDAELRVTVKRTPGGVVSNWMHDHLAEGDQIEVTRPAGFFQLGDHDGDLVAFSAGSGITPVLSLVKTALATTSRRVRLLYANRDREAIIHLAEIDHLQAEHGERFTVSHHLDVELGLIEPGEVRAFAGVSDDTQCYLCGPGQFMEVVELGLLDAGLDASRIHIERFSQSDLMPVPEEPAETAATAAARVTITLNGRTDSADHHPGTTILQTARQMGLAPPFSCEMGSCATCMALVTEGSVSMHVNNALTAEEVAEGWVLTCQSVPSGPSVHVVYE
jgi:3-ketosteroid 9alpha-monooxygenase subunit B